MTSNIVCILGVAILFLGIIGLGGMHCKCICMLIPYTFMMGLLCAFHTSVSLLLLIDPSVVINHFTKANSDSSNDIRFWVTSKIYSLIIVVAVIAGMEFLLVMFTCCYVGDERLYAEDATVTPLLGEPSYRRIEGAEKRRNLRSGYGA